MAQISGVLVLAVYHTYKLSVDFIPQKVIRLCDNTHSENKGRAVLNWSGSRRGALGDFSQESGELYADKKDAFNDYEVYVRWTNPARLLLF
jgi:hypothetical protein